MFVMFVMFIMLHEIFVSLSMYVEVYSTYISPSNANIIDFEDENQIQLWSPIAPWITQELCKM